MSVIGWFPRTFLEGLHQETALEFIPVKCGGVGWGVCEGVREYIIYNKKLISTEKISLLSVSSEVGVPFPPPGEHVGVAALVPAPRLLGSAVGARLLSYNQERPSARPRKQPHAAQLWGGRHRRGWRRGPGDVCCRVRKRNNDCVEQLSPNLDR